MAALFWTGVPEASELISQMLKKLMGWFLYGSSAASLTIKDLCLCDA